MNIDFSIEEAVRKRYSVRNYSEQELEEDVKNEMEVFIQSLKNPFGQKVNFHYLEIENVKNEKLGTYGVIKGAKQYIGTTIKLEKLSLLWSEIKQHENTNVFNNLPLLKELYISDYSPEFAKKIPPTIKI